MANGDKNYKHMVAGVLGDGTQILCFTEGSQLAVFNDTAPAELLAAQMREKYPHLKFNVLSFQVL